MDNIKKIIEKQINDFADITDNYKNILQSINKENISEIELNKIILFLDDINTLKDDINDRLYEFQNSNDINAIDVTNELKKRIDNYNLVDNSVENFSPYILLYQLCQKKN